MAAWRDQNDLLRATFADVEKEPIPVSLRLAIPKLRCVSDDETLEEAPSSAGEAPPSGKGPGTVVLVAGLLLAALGIGGSLLLVDHPASTATGPLVLALDDDDGLSTPFSISGIKKRLGDANGQDARARMLPTATIPDLGGAGFEFVSATVRHGNPPTLVFHYEDQSAKSLTLRVTRDGDTTPAAIRPAPMEHAVSWRQGGRAFSLSGAVDGARLDKIAAMLRSRRDDLDASR